MRKNLTDQMEERGMKLRTWAKAKGLSDTDFLLLYQMNSKLLYGKLGRGAEIRKILESEGFKFNLKANRKKSKFVNFDNGENGGNLVDCFVPKGTRNDGKSVDTSFFVRKNSQ